MTHYMRFFHIFPPIKMNFNLYFTKFIRCRKFAIGTALFHKGLGIGSKIGGCMDEYGNFVFGAGSKKSI